VTSLYNSSAFSASRFISYLKKVPTKQELYIGERKYVWGAPRLIQWGRQRDDKPRYLAYGMVPFSTNPLHDDPFSVLKGFALEKLLQYLARKATYGARSILRLELVGFYADMGFNSCFFGPCEEIDIGLSHGRIVAMMFPIKTMTRECMYNGRRCGQPRILQAFHQRHRMAIRTDFTSIIRSGYHGGAQEDLWI